MIHPTRHHAHQPLHKNIKLTGSETKTYNQYSLSYRLKNSKTDLIEQKTVLELRNVLKIFHSGSSAVNKKEQNDVLNRKITTQGYLQKTECFVQNTSSKNTSQDCFEHEVFEKAEISRQQIRQNLKDIPKTSGNP